MLRRTVVTWMITSGISAAQPPDAAREALQQRFAAVKQALAQSQAQLRLYSWTETTETSLKGEVKKREQMECRYGPDGKLIKSPIGSPAAPARRKGGIKGKIVAGKVDELKDYMDRVGSLVRRYVPPDPQSLQAAFQAGRAMFDPVSGMLTFMDYAKPGDRLTLAFDTAKNQIRSFAVKTYLDEPKDVVTLHARFAGLTDGASFLEESVLDAAAKAIRITTTNSGHAKSGR